VSPGYTPAERAAIQQTLREQTRTPWFSLTNVQTMSDGLRGWCWRWLAYTPTGAVKRYRVGILTALADSEQEVRSWMTR